MNIQTRVASLVKFPIEQHLGKLNEELAQVRSVAITNEQFGGSRMALATRAACEKALAGAAEIVLEQLKQVIESDESDIRNELAAEAKDAFMTEFSRFRANIEQEQERNSGSCFQEIPVNKLTETYLAKVDVFCASVLERRKQARKNTIFRFIKWVISTISGLFKQ